MDENKIKNQFSESEKNEDRSVTSQVLEYYKCYSQNRELPKYFCGTSDIHTETWKQVPSAALTLAPINQSCVEIHAAGNKDIPKIHIENVSIPSPSSSVASNRKLEWDSGADIGYSNSNLHKSISLPVLTDVEYEKLRTKLVNNNSNQDKVQKLGEDSKCVGTQSEVDNYKLSDLSSASESSKSSYKGYITSTPSSNCLQDDFISDSETGKAKRLKVLKSKVGLPIAQSTQLHNIQYCDSPQSIKSKDRTNSHCDSINLLKANEPNIDLTVIDRISQYKNMKLLKLNVCKPIIIECAGWTEPPRGKNKEIQTSLLLNCTTVGVQTDFDFTNCAVMKPNFQRTEKQSVFYISYTNSEKENSTISSIQTQTRSSDFSNCDSFQYFDKAPNLNAIKKKSQTKTNLAQKRLEFTSTSAESDKENLPEFKTHSDNNSLTNILFRNGKQTGNIRNLQRTVDILQKLMRSKKYDTLTKKFYLKAIIKQYIDTKSESSDSVLPQSEPSDKCSTEEKSNSKSSDDIFKLISNRNKDILEKLTTETFSSEILPESAITNKKKRSKRSKLFTLTDTDTHTSDLYDTVAASTYTKESQNVDVKEKGYSQANNNPNVIESSNSGHNVPYSGRSSINDKLSQNRMSEKSWREDKTRSEKLLEKKLDDTDNSNFNKPILTESGDSNKSTHSLNKQKGEKIKTSTKDLLKIVQEPHVEDMNNGNEKTTVYVLSTKKDSSSDDSQGNSARSDRKCRCICECGKSEHKPMSISKVTIESENRKIMLKDAYLISSEEFISKANDATHSTVIRRYVFELPCEDTESRASAVTNSNVESIQRPKSSVSSQVNERVPTQNTVYEISNRKIQSLDDAATNTNHKPEVSIKSSNSSSGSSRINRTVTNAIVQPKASGISHISSISEISGNPISAQATSEDLKMKQFSNFSDSSSDIKLTSNLQTQVSPDNFQGTSHSVKTQANIETETPKIKQIQTSSHKNTKEDNLKHSVRIQANPKDERPSMRPPLTQVISGPESKYNRQTQVSTVNNLDVFNSAKTQANSTTESSNTNQSASQSHSSDLKSKSNRPTQVVNDKVRNKSHSVKTQAVSTTESSNRKQSATLSQTDDLNDKSNRRTHVIDDNRHKVLHSVKTQANAKDENLKMRQQTQIATERGKQLHSVKTQANEHEGSSRNWANQPTQIVPDNIRLRKHTVVAEDSEDDFSKGKIDSNYQTDVIKLVINTNASSSGSIPTPVEITSSEEIQSFEEPNLVAKIVYSEDPQSDSDSHILTKEIVYSNEVPSSSNPTSTQSSKEVCFKEHVCCNCKKESTTSTSKTSQTTTPICVCCKKQSVQLHSHSCQCDCAESKPCNVDHDKYILCYPCYDYHQSFGCATRPYLYQGYVCQCNQNANTSKKTIEEIKKTIEQLTNLESETDLCQCGNNCVEDPESNFCEHCKLRLRPRYRRRKGGLAYSVTVEADKNCKFVDPNCPMEPLENIKIKVPTPRAMQNPSYCANCHYKPSVCKTRHDVNPSCEILTVTQQKQCLHCQHQCKPGKLKQMAKADAYTNCGGCFCNYCHSSNSIANDFIKKSKTPFYQNEVFANFGVNCNVQNQFEKISEYNVSKPNSSEKHLKTSATQKSSEGSGSSRSDYCNPRTQVTEMPQSLQGYLCKNKPRFIAMAEERRQCVLELTALREERSRRYKNRLVVKQKSSQDLRSSDRISLKGPFSTKEMKQITARNYKKCKEVQQKIEDVREREIKRANKLIYNMFNEQRK